jgi:predicted hydrolase (HD superfamily)
MRYYARLWDEDEERWGVAGLLHDMDYEQYPSLDEHPFRALEILKERGYSEETIRAIASHADHTGVERQTRMEHTLFACDELSGFVTAVAYVRPSRKIADVEVPSVLKKMKDKAFARGVSREDLVQGAEEIGLPLEEHIQHVINALQSIADEIGL